MKDLEANKIFAAILVAGIIAMMSGFIADLLIHPKKLEKDAVEIEGSSGTASAAAPKADIPEPILGLLAVADIERGKKISKVCAACHSFTKDGKNGVGPNLWNIVDAQKQAKPGYSYSGVLNTNGGDVWTYAELNAYFYKPKKYAPGTKMNYAGLKKPQDRASVVAWLRTLADTPAALPSEAQIQEELKAWMPEPESETLPKTAEEENPELEALSSENISEDVPSKEEAAE